MVASGHVMSLPVTSSFPRRVIKFALPQYRLPVGRIPFRAHRRGSVKVGNSREDSGQHRRAVGETNKHFAHITHSDALQTNRHVGETLF